MAAGHRACIRHWSRARRRRCAARSSPPRSPRYAVTADHPRRPAASLAGPRYLPIVATKAERRAAQERVSAYHRAQLAELLSHVDAAIDRYRAGEIDAYDMDETIQHYHRAAAELWKFCFARGGARMPSSPPASSTAWPLAQKPSTGGNAPHRDDTNDHHRRAFPARVPRL